ncbi:glycosyltransferase [Novipirellula sp. SH528]|uniref:glycosyltransferase n=1 Tax=Novipirellula sp. SH528 TaxID=3454466 RepID=UPI003F9F3DBA
MNILFIATTYPTPTRPRQGTFNYDLVASLRQNHDVRVIAPVPWIERLCSSKAGANSPSRDGEYHPTYFYPPKLLRHRYDDFYWQSILPSIKKLALTFAPDLVLSYWLHPDGKAAQRAARFLNAPCVVVSGGSDLRILAKVPSRKTAIQQVLSEAARLVVVSQDLATKAIDLGMSRDKIDVVYRGVDQRCFYPSAPDQARDACGLPRDAIVLLWSGRLEPVKNPSLLFHAATRWLERWGEQLKIIVAGDGSMRKELTKLCSRLGLDECVLMEGNLSQQELAIRFNAADITVLTSHSEGIPNVLLESISCGVPFVATDVGGVSEIATTGLDRLVPEDDIGALVDAVIKQIESPSCTKRDFLPAELFEMSSRFESILARVLSSWQADCLKAAQ